LKELERLNAEQRRAVLHAGRPLLILAGAGSGKTRVITTKIAHLVTTGGLDPRSILAVTFTNRAAAEMRERVLALVPPPVQAADVMIRTFHSFGAWLLRRHNALAGLPDRFSIYDDEDQLSLLKSVAGDDEKRGDLRSIVAAIARAKDACLGPGDDLQPLSVDPRLAPLYAAYQARLDAVGCVDFGDLITKPVHLLREQAAVAERIRDRFRVILVDEYQDSNRAQFLLLKELHREGNYLCVVGDEDQSIYGFRGAEVRNILEFPQAFPGTEIIRLEQNYRSTGTIVEAATRVVEKNRQRLGKSLWTENSGGTPLTVALLADEDEEARHCASLLQGREPSTCAILYRNNYQSRAFETTFRNLGIPYRIVGSVRFWERAEVKDALAYLELLVNPRDEVAFRRVINRPSRGIGETSVAAILAAPGGDLVQRCRAARLRGNAARGAAAFVEAFDTLHEQLAALALADFAASVVRVTGLLAYYTDKDGAEARGRAANLEELVNACTPYPAGADGLVEFLERVSLDTAVDEGEERQNAVTLITVHNTKGLEFDHVFITGLEDGLFPSRREDEGDEDLEEERRLFYVALTRARVEVHMTTCVRRRVFGAWRERPPSRFLGEIPRELITVVRSGSDTAAADAEEDDAPHLPVGCAVYHNDYGPGMIVRKWKAGENTMAQVRFSSGRSAQFILRYAKLERISADQV
jgi:DNA helicase II / ATP-dependent DNA helicase PcrA